MIKLNKHTIEARMNIYDEIIEHLNMALTDDKIEYEQQLIVQKQLKKQFTRWYNKYGKIINIGIIGSRSRNNLSDMDDVYMGV